MSGEPNGWNEYKKLVVHRLDELTSISNRIETKLNRLSTKVTILETKAIIYGAIAGLGITVIVQFVLNFI